jgi:flagellar protein FlgJ
MTLPVADPSLFADAQSLATLKSEAAAHNPQALKVAARQFESLFIDMMLKSARAANFKDPLFGSSQSRFYQDLYDQQLSTQLSKTHTFGLAEMLVQQLRRQWAGSGGSSPSATGSAAAAAPASAGVAQAPSASVGPPAASTATAVSPEQQSAFARSVWPDAERAARQLGVSPVGLVAQAALETDWGRSLPRTAAGQTSNNLFGIKANGPWRGASVRSATQEYVNGSPVTVQAPFRAYGSCAECFKDYASLLSSNPRFAAALGTGDNVGAFASALQQAGYATDPNYARKLTAVADSLSRVLGASGSAGPLKLAATPPISTGTSAL